MKIISTLEELSLEILQVNISSVDETVVNSFTIKVNIYKTTFKKKKIFKFEFKKEKENRHAAGTSSILKGTVPLLKSMKLLSHCLLL